MQREISSLPEFREILVKGFMSPRCVDGRPAEGIPMGAQMLGGSYLPVLLDAITNGIDFNKPFVAEKLSLLKEKGYGIGAHRGENKNPEEGKSDCGFADKMPQILETAIKQRGKITERLNSVYDKNRDKIGHLDTPFSKIIADAYMKLGNFYRDNKIDVSGENLLRATVPIGATISQAKGNHAEEVAYVNLVKGTTFDTNESNKRGKQAFNLDLWAAMEQAGALGVSPWDAMGLSLILYQATEMVLVEDKGNPALPIIIR